MEFVTDTFAFANPSRERKVTKLEDEELISSKMFSIVLLSSLCVVGVFTQAYYYPPPVQYVANPNYNQGLFCKSVFTYTTLTSMWVNINDVCNILTHPVASLFSTKVLSSLPVASLFSTNVLSSLPWGCDVIYVQPHTTANHCSAIWV